MSGPLTTPGTWEPVYEKWVDMLAGLNRGPGHELVAWNSALLYDMIYTQPVVYELPLLKPPVVLMIGDKDTTAIGKDLAPPEVRAKLGNYPVLGKETVAHIPRRAPDRVPRSRSRAADPGSGGVPQGAAGEFDALEHVPFA